MDELRTSQTTTVPPKVETWQSLPMAEKMAKARELVWRAMCGFYSGIYTSHFVWYKEPKMECPLNKKEIEESAQQLCKLSDQEFKKYEAAANRNYQEVLAQKAHYEKKCAIAHKITKEVATLKHQEVLENRLKDLLGDISLSNRELDQIYTETNDRPHAAQNTQNAPAAETITRHLSERIPDSGVQADLTPAEQKKLRGVLLRLDEALVKKLSDNDKGQERLYQKKQETIRKIAQEIEPNATSDRQQNLEYKLNLYFRRLSSEQCDTALNELNHPLPPNMKNASVVKSLVDDLSARKDPWGLFQKNLTSAEKQKLMHVFLGLEDSIIKSLAHAKMRLENVDNRKAAETLAKKLFYKTDANGKKVPLTKDDVDHMQLSLSRTELAQLQKEHPNGFDIHFHPSKEVQQKAREIAATALRVGHAGVYLPATQEDQEVIAKGLSCFNLKSLTELQRRGVHILMADSSKGLLPRGQKTWDKNDGGCYDCDSNIVVLDRIHVFPGEVVHEMEHALDHWANKNKAHYYASQSDLELQQLHEQHVRNVRIDDHLEWSQLANTDDVRDYLAEGRRMYESSPLSRFILEVRDPGLYRYLQQHPE